MRLLLRWQTEDREEFRNATRRPEGFFHQIDCHTPPGEDGRQDKEIRCGFDAIVNTRLAEGKETAGDCRTDSQAEEGNRKSQVPRKRRDSTAPSKESEHNKPRSQLREMGVDAMSWDRADRL